MAENLRQPITWRPEFATGVAIIDDQHRVLVTMLSSAEEKLTDRSPIEDFRLIVQGLLNYAGYHFGTEESLMNETGFRPAMSVEAARHQAEHKSFAGKVAAIQAGLLAGEPITKAELLDFLSHWLVDHILDTDKIFAAFVRDLPRRSGKEIG